MGDLKRRVDFSFSARAVMVRPGGALAVGPILKESGIYQWLAAFRARSVRVRYFSLGHIWLVSLGAVAIIVAIVAAIGVNSVT